MTSSGLLKVKIKLKFQGDCDSKNAGRCYGIPYRVRHPFLQSFNTRITVLFLFAMFFLFLCTLFKESPRLCSHQPLLGLQRRTTTKSSMIQTTRFWEFPCSTRREQEAGDERFKQMFNQNLLIKCGQVAISWGHAAQWSCLQPSIWFWFCAS